MRGRTAQAALSCRCAAIHLVAPDEADPAEHNGDIWSRGPTKYGTILAAKIVLFLLDISINRDIPPWPYHGGIFFKKLAIGTENEYNGIN